MFYMLKRNDLDISIGICGWYWLKVPNFTSLKKSLIVGRLLRPSLEPVLQQAGMALGNARKPKNDSGAISLKTLRLV